MNFIVASRQFDPDVEIQGPMRHLIGRLKLNRSLSRRWKVKTLEYMVI